MQRQKNFSDAEKKSLINLIFLQRDVIENKESDRLIMVKKDKAWADITAQYNVNATIPRSEKSLRNCWDNMKKAARKYCAAIKRESYKTGINFFKNMMKYYRYAHQR
ncbi:Uncharacterized protein DBV15_12572 [Temnothorax longispinosus]|uniref:Regulatory protein zeste n=1 Tax=Temnothorax longispinosus TaxID=300112 RepID=A0A4S2KG12_9HYME|nr:Uncharacterized protein DBV15_12572 [Temnothorax longispinosus]